MGLWQSSYAQSPQNDDRIRTLRLRVREVRSGPAGEGTIPHSDGHKLRSYRHLIPINLQNYFFIGMHDGPV